ncbi:hypothetical protein FD754_000946 [Muntiacus muntjak]|uniref:1-alkyl-2-acetylglycerophosphocholine esterase n=1 Tax=Muntiacus muntjak TaxID=9888 RepID=A0A5N3W532_MUNMU|nr:hypothetical protein FD754_000946 [Muntiacus muntjak]
MLPSKLHALFCLCTCLALVYPFDWQDLNPVAYIKSEAWVNNMQALMAAASIGQTKIPRGNGSYSVGCTDLMFNYTNKGTFLRLYYPSQDDGHSDTLWIPNKEYFLGLSKFLGTHWLVGKIMNLLFGSVTIPAAWNAPLRTGEKYPLIIFTHGLGAFRELGSHTGLKSAPFENHSPLLYPRMLLSLFHGRQNMKLRKVVVLGSDSEESVQLQGLPELCRQMEEGKSERVKDGREEHE